MLKSEKHNTLNFQIYSALIYSVTLFFVVASSLYLTGGHLVYTLDDPYIHLAVAESILEGGYGINSGEYASPSSSILYPFLLAMAIFLGFGEFAPIILTAPFSFLAVWLLSGFIWRVAAFERGYTSPILFWGLGPAIVLSINAIALPMTGMEHSIQVFGSILAFTGLYDLTTSDKRNTGILAVVAGTIISSTIRFEGLALAVAICGSLCVLGYRFQAGLIVLCVSAILGVYATFMMSFGLPIFPSSVMVKSDIAASASDGNAFGLLKGMLSNTYHSLTNRWGVLFALASTAFAAILFSTNKTTEKLRFFYISAIFTLFAHVVAGRYGWFGRYEVYAVAVMLVGLFSMPFVTIKSSAASLSLPLGVFIVAAPYLRTTISTPAASLNIYQQQYQMQKFVKEFLPENVAVNDLGYVSFRNDNYVLDLWGLGSEEARRLSRNNQWTPELLSEITLRHDISYAMIYDTWFREVPVGWCRIGNLVTSQLTSASGSVSFYLIKSDEQQQMRAALQAFAAELPAGARMKLFDCETPP